MTAPKAPVVRKPTQADLKEAAIVQAELLHHYKFIAAAVGVDEDTLLAWRQKDAEFSVRLEQARSRFTGRHIRKAKSEFLLERLEPEVFKQRMDVTSDDKPLNVALVEFVGPKGKK